MYRKLFVLSLAVQSVLFAVVGMARMPGPPSLEEFQRHFDSDGDGQVTRGEIQLVRTREFQQADVDGNGHVGLAEFLNWEKQRRRKQLQQRLERLDLNADGRLSEAEFVNGHLLGPEHVPGSVFRLADIDGDALLNLTELQALDDNRDAWHFAHMDRNADNGIALDEFLQAPLPGGPGHPRP